MLIHYAHLKKHQAFYLSPQPLKYKASDTLVVMVMDGCEFIRLSELKHPRDVHKNVVDTAWALSFMPLAKDAVAHEYVGVCCRTAQKHGIALKGP